MTSDLRDDIDGQPLADLHKRGDSKIAKFKYVKPTAELKSKGYVRVGGGELMRISVQVLKKHGGENNLHYHTNAETVWWVLKGKASFYGEGDVLLGEFGPNEGIVTPRYCRYWFENSGDEDLELIQIAASDMKGNKSGRKSITPLLESMDSITLFDERGQVVPADILATLKEKERN
jgi:mannose-6-phosphate isomerase-like protein (cupin superfamily)